ncbi:MAG TPA: SDR family NAD(P)-dependent oxidoreductase [Azospirillum sp.]
MSRLAGRMALITGASRGIGAAVAKRFAAEGAHVVLTARTVGALEEVDDAIQKETGQNATLVTLNLMEFDKIDQLGQAIYERFGRLDIVVGNAAVLETLGPIATYDPKHWQRIMDTNVTANYRLIRSMDRLLRASDAGRAIFVTSGAARAPYPYWGPYAVSKAALEMMVQTYAMEVAKSNLRVNLVDPGVVRTRMRTQAFPGEDPNTLPPPESVTGPFVDLAEAACTRHGEIVKA